MATIYKLGSRSNLWLGADENGIAQALWYVNHFDVAHAATEYPESDEDRSSKSSVGQSFDMDRMSKAIRLTTAEDKNLSGAFGSCGLWMRIWILQEIVFAPLPVLICGQQVLSWKKLANFLRTTKTTKIKLDHGQEPSWIESTGFQHLLLMDELRNIHNDLSRASNSQSTLYSLLASCRKFRSSDGRDMLYTLLNVACDDTGIEPNYNISASEMWAAALKTLMRIDGKLKFVHSINLSSIQILPSWAKFFHRTKRYEQGSGFTSIGPEVLSGESLPNWMNERHRIRYYGVPNEAIDELVVESTRLLSFESFLRTLDNFTLHDILHFWDMTRVRDPYVPKSWDAASLLFALIEGESHSSQPDFWKGLLRNVFAEHLWYSLDEEVFNRNSFYEEAANDFPADGVLQRVLPEDYHLNVTCSGTQNCKFYQYSGAKLGDAPRAIMETLLSYRLAVIKRQWNYVIIVFPPSLGGEDQVHYVDGSPFMPVLRPVSHEKRRFEINSMMFAYYRHLSPSFPYRYRILAAEESVLHSLEDTQEREQIILV